MPIYQYRAKNKKNQQVEGTIEAESRDAAADSLLGKDLIVTQLDLKKEGFDFGTLIARLTKKVSKKDLAIFLRQLSILISASVPLVQALRMISAQNPNPTLRDAVSSITDDVEGGLKLSSALGRYPNIFNSFFVNMVKSGETSGRLDEVLLYLADQQEKDYELNSKIKGAMVYPAFIVAVMGVAGIILMVFVLPKMLAIFTELGPSIKLPLATRALIGLTNVFEKYWWAILLVVGGIIAGLRYASLTPKGKIIKDKIFLKLPIFGNLFRFIYIVRFTRSLGLTLIGGVTVTNGLAVIRDVIGNSVFEDIITTAIREVEDGTPLSVSLAVHKEMPEMVAQMITVGEQTGRLDEVLEKLTSFYTREINSIVENILTLIEPIIMIILGVAVGIIISAVLMPMYNLANQL